MGSFCCQTKTTLIQNDFDFDQTITNKNNSTFFSSHSDIIKLQKPYKQGPILKKILCKRKIPSSN